MSDYLLFEAKLIKPDYNKYSFVWNNVNYKHWCKIQHLNYHH